MSLKLLRRVLRQKPPKVIIVSRGLTRPKKVPADRTRTAYMMAATCASVCMPSQSKAEVTNSGRVHELGRYMTIMKHDD